MPRTPSAVGPLLISAGMLLAQGAQPTAAELAQRDAWVQAHVTAPAPATDTAAAAPGLTVLANLGPVFADRLPDKPLQIAGQKFDHGLYCHGPSRVRVRLPAPGKTFSAKVGILDNPASVGGSIVFGVEVDERSLARSPVQHRGAAAALLRADLGGASELVLAVSCAGDGLSSDQAVWGDAKVTLADGKELWVSDLPLREPISSERGPGALPFSFTYGGVASDRLLATWPSELASEPAAAGKRRHVRTWTDPITRLCVRFTAVEYTDYPTVEWTLDFENRGDRDTPRLEGILPLDTWVPRRAGGDFLLHHFRGSPCQANDYEPFATVLGPGTTARIATDGGRPTNTALPYFDVETGTAGGVIAVLGWSGQWAAQFTPCAKDLLRLAGGQEATSFRLHPGERARSPLALLQFYDGDWLRAQNVWRRWMLAHNVPRHDGKTLQPFVFGCTGNYYPGLKTEAATELAFFQAYVDAGFRPDYWDQDAGWYPCGDGWWNVGSWEVDRTRWPQGLRQGSDALHRHGIGSIVWFEPERLAPGTWLAQNHPEWCFGGAGGGLMRIGDPGYRAWITDRIDQLVTSEGIDFYRQDCNIDPLYSWRGDDADDRLGLAEIRHVEGYLAFWDELVRRHPKLWIDSCASGGRRNDLETLRRAVPILRSDFAGDPKDAGYDPSSQQNHIHGISLWMPFHGSGFGHVDDYWARSVMGPITGIGFDTRSTELDKRGAVRVYELIRKVQRFYVGDFWPLLPYRGDTGGWAAYQYDLGDGTEGLLQAFRRKTCAEATYRLRLRGLVAAANYELTDLDSGKVVAGTGQQWLAEGIEVAADKPQTALVFTYRRAK